MKLIIDISEDSYKATCNGYMLPPDVENVVQGIKNGIPLPKGYGRIADIDAAIECIKEVKGEDATWAIALIEWACGKRTILEADETDDTIPNEGSNHEFSDSIAKAAKDMFGINLKKEV